MELQHISHEHPLVFIQDWSRASEEEEKEEALCSACEEEVEGPCYCCSRCIFYLHKTCAELELYPEIKHPFHPRHPLILLPKSPYSGMYGCNLCGWAFSGLVYHCASCQFDLDIHCASITGNFDKLQHPFHEHSLIFIEKHNRIIRGDCLVCGKEISSDPFYKCLYCHEVSLHEKCAELRLEICHPFHPMHPLKLELESTHQKCNLCSELIRGYHYYCASCDFGLDINCASIAGSFDKLPTPSHEHPLIFIKMHNIIIRVDCLGCGKEISSDPFYICLDCDEVYFHPICAELPPETRHPIHRQHPLFSKLESTHHLKCNLCHEFIREHYYLCTSCDFFLDMKCVSIRGNFDKLEHPFHKHPLIFIEKHNIIIRGDCFICRKEISSNSFYTCSDCKEVYLHEKCAKLPKAIKVFYHQHPLFLLNGPPIHSKSCSCYLCKIQWKDFAYCCEDCRFGLTIEDFSLLTSSVETHEHPWTPFFRQMSYICDFCGTAGDRTPCLCTTCYFIVHARCTSLPLTLTITRHPHQLSHSYVLPHDKFEDCKCQICYKEVNTRYGSYYCFASNCNYIAHVNCATDPSIWDPNDEDELSKGESMNWITDIIQTESLNGDEIATKIKHSFDKHNLILIFIGEVNDDSNCDACMGPISTPFYSCKECRFFLHKTCAELPREKRHPSHKHLLTLSKGGFHALSNCFACNRNHNGFRYRCKKRDCYFEIDIPCSLLLDSFSHPSHKHPLFLDHNCHGNCSGCRDEIRSSFAYKCTWGCDQFIVDFKCLTLPQKAWYKYDKHPLSLTYDAGSDADQFYCDVCEEERDPNKWFYSCVDCDNSAHLECVLGDLPLIKIGKTWKFYGHPHKLTFVKNIWNCPPCAVCKKLCYGQALQCVECNIIIHWKCRFGLTKLYGD